MLALSLKPLLGYVCCACRLRRATQPHEGTVGCKVTEREKGTRARGTTANLPCPVESTETVLSSAMVPVVSSTLQLAALLAEEEEENEGGPLTAPSSSIAEEDMLEAARQAEQELRETRSMAAEDVPVEDVPVVEPEARRRQPPVVLDVKVKARVRKPGEQTATTSTLSLRVQPGDTLELALTIREAAP